MHESSTSKEQQAANQRRFFLNLYPQGGHFVAKNLGGFMDPGEDGQEAEIKASMTHWLKMQHSGAILPVYHDAWWMTRFMDPYSRKNKLETDVRHNELMSFAIAVVSDLIDDGHLEWAKDVEVPNIMTSTHDLIDDVDQAVLDRLEAQFKGEEG